MASSCFNLILWSLETESTIGHISYGSLLGLSSGLEEVSIIRAFDYGLFVDVPNGICMVQKYIILHMFGT